MIPEWQVFIRHPDGSAEQFTFTRKRQLMILAGMCVVIVWAGMVSTLLTRQPEEIAVKERQLEEMMAATRAAQHRLASSQKLVADIAREVDQVHSNIRVLAESNATLAKSLPPPKVAAAPTRSRAGVELAGNEDNHPASAEARALRDQVRRLEGSLDRLRHAYAQALQNTNAAASSRVFDAERILTRLGIDARQLFERPQPEGGRGGPFIPVSANPNDSGLHGLLDRLDQLSVVKSVMRSVPLGKPLLVDHEVSSSFGTRADPLNRRTGLHEGIDFTAPHGSPIYATGEGVVEFAGAWDRYGLAVEIDHGNGITTRYAHLSRIKVKEGQKVTRSTVIGLLGNTGRSTGPHLHYEVRLSDTPKNPLKFIEAGTHAP